MSHKVDPISFKLGLTIPWSNRWFFKKSLRYFIEEDYLIREFIRSKILQAGIAAIEIERIGDKIRVSIRAARPGLVIGRGGKTIEELKSSLIKNVTKLRQKNNKSLDVSLNLNIEELKRSEISAPVIAQQIAFDIERRLSYRRVIKRYLDIVTQNREVKGAKIKISGRLNGSEISRRDWVASGRMPLQTLRAKIDYGKATAFNSYGTIGIKVWLYKGEVFDDKTTSQ